MRVIRVLAPNPGPFTGPGTNTYLLESDGEMVILDPGPRIESHEAAIREAIGDHTPVMVAVTHTHPDHAPAANPLASDLGVPAYGHSPGPGFKPDVRFADMRTVRFGTAELEAVPTPGHTPDHLCFRVDRLLFSGDHVMGGSTVIIDDLGDYLESLRLVRGLDLDMIHPGHGMDIDDPHGVIDYYIEHRLDRERQVLEALGGGAGTVGEVVENVYIDTDPALHFAAVYSVAAHLRKLKSERRVEFGGAAEWGAAVELLEEDI